MRHLFALTLITAGLAAWEPSIHGQPIAEHADPLIGVSESTAEQSLPVRSEPKVHVVYLVPADRTVRQDYAEALAHAIVDLRAWFANQMKEYGRKTFTIASPTVSVVALPHDASYYSTNPQPNLFTQFWGNVLNDAMPLTGGRFNDPENVWAYYIDADAACGQCAGCGAAGVLLIGANDLRGFLGEPYRPACPTDWDTPSLGRYIGGLGHELGHAFGLPHPKACDEGKPDCDWEALMWNGFRHYPNTYLRPDEKATLDSSPFFLKPRRRLLWR